MPKTNNFKDLLLNHFFNNSANITSDYITRKPIGWWLSLHETTNNPTNAQIPDTWRTNEIHRKTIVEITNWGAVNGNWKNGATISEEIAFDYVPQGSNWNIKYYIIWAQYAEDDFFPLYYGVFPSVIELAELNLLYLAPNKLTLIEN